MICILALPGCKGTKPENTETLVESKIPLLPEKPKDTTVSPDDKEPKDLEEEEIEIPVINLNSEEAIKDYLVGEWISDKETLSDYLSTESEINCNMTIEGDLNVKFYFYNRYSGETIGDYLGTISLDKIDENAEGLPDLMAIDLGESDWPGGDYFFLHRTIYDGKRVMSLFFSGNGNGILDLLGDIDNFQYGPEEVLFEKDTGEKSQCIPLKDREFYAVYWGLGPNGKSLWLDNVQWTPTEEYDPDALYPTRMTLYQDDFPESTLYTIAKENITDILINPMYPGEVYFVQTDKDGNIIDFEDAAFKEYIEIINKP